MSLPHCDTVFASYLDPWYSVEDRERKKWPATRPDLLRLDSFVGVPQAELCVLNKEGECDVRLRIERMLEACRGDWPRYLKVVGDIDEHWIEAFDKYYDRVHVADVIKRSDPKDFSNDFISLVCEFGAALGSVLRTKEPRLAWSYDWPYWESSLVDTKTGSLIPPFHWAVKKFSEYGLEDGFVQKIEMCVRVINTSKA